MGIVEFATIVATLCGVAKGIQLFSRHCRRRFGHSFLSSRGFWLAAISINFLWWGYYFWTTTALRHTPPFGGLILMAMGFAVATWLIVENVRDTDLVHGIGGSCLQFVLFVPVALYGIPLLVIAMCFLLFATYKGGPAWFVDP